MSTKKEKTYVVCWKRGREYNYFYCGGEKACIDFIIEAIDNGYEIDGVFIKDDEEGKK